MPRRPGGNLRSMNVAADPVLQALVFAVDTARGQMSVTLAVNGAVITGILVSAEEYAATVVAQIRRSRAGNGEGEGLEDFFTPVAEQARERRERHAAVLAGGSAPEPELPAYLHLVDAFTVTGDHLPQGPGATWRIRVDDVGGWSVNPISAPGRRDS